MLYTLAARLAVSTWRNKIRIRRPFVTVWSAQVKKNEVKSLNNLETLYYESVPEAVVLRNSRIAKEFIFLNIML